MTTTIEIPDWAQAEVSQFLRAGGTGGQIVLNYRGDGFSKELDSVEVRGIARPPKRKLDKTQNEP